MSQLLNKVKKQISKVSHMNNQEKLCEMTKHKVGWNDILCEAEEHNKGMTTEGNVCWPPACNPSNSQVPLHNFRANLTQFNSNGNHNGNGKKSHFKRNRKNGNRNHKFNKKNRNKGNTKEDAWKFQPPRDNKTPKNIRGVHLYEKVVNRRKFQWC